MMINLYFYQNFFNNYPYRHSMKMIFLIPIITLIICSPFPKTVKRDTIRNHAQFSCNIPPDVTNDSRILGKWKLNDFEVRGCWVDRDPEPYSSENYIIKFSDSLISGYYPDSLKNTADNENILKGKWYIKNHKLYVCFSWVKKSSYFVPDTVHENWSYFKYAFEDETTMVWETDCFCYRYKKYFDLK